MDMHSAFAAVAYKRLTRVDLPARGSNQHEINGSAALRDFFGTSQSVRGTMDWCFFADDVEPVHSSGQFTFYDARLSSADRTQRTEWRLYYSGGFLSIAQPGDALILARERSGKLHGLIFRENSAWLRAGQTLFAIASIHHSLTAIPSTTLAEQELVFSRRQLLDELGIEVPLPVVPQDEEVAARELGFAQQALLEFPRPQRMSELARSLSGVDATDPDLALVAWLNREEQLFRAIERIVVQRKLSDGFADVDDFVSYSLTVQNRRKSRMGLALQNHLASVFTQHGIRYETQKRTERKNTPDFLFPGQAEYLDHSYDASLLAMLGAKSSCKERWRQVLTEADRIQHKHLCTLEQAISPSTIAEMQEQHLTLVIPAGLRASYASDQQEDIITLSAFIDMVRTMQTAP